MKYTIIGYYAENGGQPFAWGAEAASPEEAEHVALDEIRADVPGSEPISVGVIEGEHMVTCGTDADGNPA